MIGKISGALKLFTDRMALHIVAQNGFAASSVKASLSQMGLLKSIKSVTSGLWQMLPAFGKIAVVAGAILIAVKIVDAFTISAAEANEKLEKTVQEVADLHSEQESLNSELETTRQRIAELKAQGTLTFTEEAELTRLQKENAELERKLELTKANKAASKSEFEGDFLDAFDKNYGNKSTFNYQGRRNWLDKLADGFLEGSETRFTAEEYTNDLFASYEKALSGDKAYEHNLDKYKERINDVYKDYQEYLKQLEDAGYSYGTNEQIDAYIDQINEFNDKYLVAFGNTENLFAQIVSRDKFSDGYAAIKELGNVTQETLSQLYNENEKVRELINYLMGLGTVDWKTILGDDKFTELDTNADGTLTTLELFDQTTGECKVTSEQFSQAMSGVANELNKVEEAAEEAETSFKSIAKTLSDGLDKLSNKKDILSEVKEQLDSFGAISADNISKILEQFSDNDDVQKAVAYYLSGIGTAQQVFDAISKGYQDSLEVQAQTLAAKMQNNEEYYEAIGGLDKSFTDWLAANYGVDLKNCTNLAKTKLEVEQSLIKKLKNDWQGYYGLQADNLALAQRQAANLYSEQKKFGNPNSEDYKQAKHNWEIATEAYKQYLQMEERLNNLVLSSFDTTGFNNSLSTNFDKSGKTAAEKYFDELKYKLETNQITQEQYLKDLDAAYKRFYGNATEYLEEYAKYSQEVYDGFKDMYKDDLDAQKDSLEKQKDALRDFYDERKKLLEEANEEEDYEKDKSEKLQEINELKILIAKLRTVGTQNAQKRIAELEEELSKAQEDYDEFEKEHILEKALENIEKEYETQEKKIQSQIDSIQDKLDKIDKDTLSVRDAIIDFAAKYGVNLDFAYGNGSTGTPVDKSNNNANNKDITVGSTIVVKDTATHFSAKSNNVKMKSFVPGSTYEVLKISGNEVKIGRDGVATGWINKSDIVGYARGTYSAIGGLSRINETGLEMVAAPDGNGNYVNLLPKSKVFTAKATKFLWDLATKQQLPQAMYNSIAKTISTRTGLPNISVSQPITVQMGNIIIEGNADDKTLQLIKKAQEGMTRKVLEDIKKLQNKKGL